MRGCGRCRISGWIRDSGRIKIRTCCGTCLSGATAVFDFGIDRSIGRLGGVTSRLIERQVGILVTLGDGLHAHRVGEDDDHAHDGVVARVAQGVADEALVDLELIQRQPLKVGERRVAGSEIIQREADAVGALTLTETLRAAVSGRIPQTAASLQARSRMQSPSARIRPVFSATGMNSAGGSVRAPDGPSARVPRRRSVGWSRRPGAYTRARSR